MKKLATVFLAALVLAFILNACKSSEHCPAYGQVDPPQTTQHG